MESSKRKLKEQWLIFHLKIYVEKNEVTNTYYINLVDAIIRCQDLSSSCMVFKNRRNLLMSGAIFVIYIYKAYDVSFQKEEHWAILRLN